MTSKAILCISATVFLLAANAENTVMAQAYINQVSPGERGVYVPQAPADARPRPPEIPRKPKPRIAKRAAAPARANPYPSVGRGTSAVVMSTAISQWPTVGAGVVNQ
ncbi:MULTISPECIES: hypothetical protein [unclassified Rhizobium]|uniref:hypothetical protein n=1 Tax=unclassified Rhizobium TaxID=2613769 RepID=UPI00160FE869|nr:MULTISPECIES: hypothetical protein [unclassified Rhizobium]MBB3320086.1 hypothetical protein [Rhizobium sp. BK181]MCS3744072.1 hypothetical protein [Rhizobium sp. BK661]